MLRLELLESNELIWREALDVVVDVRLRKARPQRFQVVAEVVQDFHIRAGEVNRNAGVRREGAEISHHLRSDGHLILGQRIEGVEHDGGDIPGRPWSIFGAIAEDSLADRLTRFFRLDSCCERGAIEPEKFDSARFAALDYFDFVLFQVGDRIVLSDPSRRA